jgi:hypothetical protein
MIAAYALVDEPEPGLLGQPRNVQSVHLTHLLTDGSDRERGEKAKTTKGSPKKIIQINGEPEELSTPIVLAPPNDLQALAITEGIEDALSIHQALGIGAWAAGSAPCMPKLALRVPDYIEVVHVELHPDDGRAHAEKLIIYIFVALAFAATPLLGAIVFLEPISPRLVIGIGLIVCCLLLVAG